jgi:hypothetical protein
VASRILENLLFTLLDFLVGPMTDFLDCLKITKKEEEFQLHPTTRERENHRNLGSRCDSHSLTLVQNDSPKKKKNLYKMTNNWNETSFPSKNDVVEVSHIQYPEDGCLSVKNIV